MRKYDYISRNDLQDKLLSMHNDMVKRMPKMSTETATNVLVENSKINLLSDIQKMVEHFPSVNSGKKLIEKEAVRDVLCRYIPQILDASEDARIRSACAGILADMERLGVTKK